MLGAGNQIINTFQLGINTDTDPQFLKQGEYINASNISIVINKLNQSRSVQAMIGNRPISLIGDVEIEGRVIGGTSIVDYIIIFTEVYDADIISENIIYRLSKKSEFEYEVHQISRWNTSDFFSLGRGPENATRHHNPNRLSIVANFENEEVVKVYYADGINPLCYVDVINGNNIPYHKLPVSFFDININLIGPGDLDDGVYEYSYQTYFKNGSQSSTSTPTAVIPINKTDGRSGSISLSINNLDNSNDLFIRVFSLYRKSLIESPEVYIIYDEQIVSNSITITHSTNSNTPSMTYDEFLSINSNVIIPSCIKAVDGKMTAANIEYFNGIEADNYDSRAYSVSMRGSKNEQYNEIGLFNPTKKDIKYFNINNRVIDDVVDEINSTIEVVNEWLPLSVANTEIESIEQGTNKIKLFDTEVYGDYAYHPTPDSTGFYSRGGIGRNIEYKIITTPLLEDKQTSAWSDNGFVDFRSSIDNSPSDELINYLRDGVNYFYKTNVSVPYSTLSLSSNSKGKINNVYSGNQFGLDYSNPTVSAKLRGFQHDSVYNLGIVFIDKFGIKSGVFHIDTVRFPSSMDADYRQFQNGLYVNNGVDSIGGYGAVSFPLGIEVTIKSWPKGAVAANIVYSERGRLNRNVLHQGIITNMHNSSDNISSENQVSSIKARLPIHPSISKSLTYFGNTEITQFCSVPILCSILTGPDNSDKLFAFFCPDYDYGEHKINPKNSKLNILGVLHTAMRDDNRYFCGINVCDGDTFFSPEIINSYPYTVENKIYAKRLRPEKSIGHIFQKILASSINVSNSTNTELREQSFYTTLGKQLSIVFKMFNIVDCVYIEPLNSYLKIGNLYNIKDSRIVGYATTPGDGKKLSDFELTLVGEKWNESRGNDSESTKSHIEFISSKNGTVAVSNMSGARDAYCYDVSTKNIQAIRDVSIKNLVQDINGDLWNSSTYKLDSAGNAVKKDGSPVSIADMNKKTDIGNVSAILPIDMEKYKMFNFSIDYFDSTNITKSDFLAIESGVVWRNNKWILPDGRTPSIIRFSKFIPTWSYGYVNPVTNNSDTFTYPETYLACFLDSNAILDESDKGTLPGYATYNTYGTSFVYLNQDMSIPTISGSTYNGNISDASVHLNLRHSYMRNNVPFFLDDEERWTGEQILLTGESKRHETQDRSGGGFDPVGAGGNALILYAEDLNGNTPYDVLSKFLFAGRSDTDKGAPAFRSGFHGTYRDGTFNAVRNTTPSVSIYTGDGAFNSGISRSYAETSVALSSIKNNVSWNLMIPSSSDVYRTTGTVCVKDSDRHSILPTFGGDVYPCVHSHIYTHFVYGPKDTSTAIDPMSSSMYLYYPSESSINPYMANDLMAVDGSTMLEYENVPYVSPRTLKNYENPAYSYNTVFSSIGSDSNYIEEVDTIRKFSSRISYSDSKINNEYIDSWLHFAPLNFIDIDGTDGGINSLVAHSNVLYAIGDNSIQGIGVGERALTQNQSDSRQILLGTGDSFRSYYIVSNSYGVNRNDGCGALNINEYSMWYDREKNTIIRLRNGQVDPISISQSIQNLLRPMEFRYYTKFIYDYEESNSYMYGQSIGGYAKLIKHEDIIDRFTSTYDTDDNVEYIQTKNGIVSFKNGESVSVWKERSGEICTIFGEKKDCSITVSSMVEGAINGVFDYTVIPDINLSNQLDASIKRESLNGRADDQYNQIYLDDLSSRQYRENSFYIPVGRVRNSNLRLRGNRLIQNIIIKPDSYTNFSIPYIKTFYRQSTV